VKDLFPDLGEGFIEACLIACEDDAEQVIMRLLEDNLPEHVKKLDRKMGRTIVPPPSIRSSKPSSPPRSTTKTDTPPGVGRGGDGRGDGESVLEKRANIFDGDEFDVFSRPVDMSKVILGKKSETDNVLTEKPPITSAQKALILNTLYDEYEDEYDDTYDSTDATVVAIEAHLPDEDDGKPTTRGSAAGSSAGGTTSDPFASYEEILVNLFMSNPSVFEPTRRKDPERARLKKETGMADEQIEGWGKMFARNPNKARIIERYEWRGQQNTLQRQNWDEGNTEDNDDDNDNDGGQGGAGRGGAGGRGGG
ncbi:hypothetical protein HK102_011142, partial [Quaeritorhiza haematococci]